MLITSQAALGSGQLHRHTLTTDSSSQGTCVPSQGQGQWEPTA